MRRFTLSACLAVAACGAPPAHRFTDVADSKPSPDRRAVAALVWDEHGAKSPHVTGLVVVAPGSDPRDGEPVILTSDDFHPIDFRWTGPAALTLRLPCGRWSHLANHALVAGRTVTIAFTPARGCYVGPAGTGALPGDSPADTGPPGNGGRAGATPAAAN